MTREMAAVPKMHPLGAHSKQRRKLGRFFHNFAVQIHFPSETMREPLLCTATNINSTGMYLTNVQHPFQLKEQIIAEIVHPTELLPQIPGTISRIDQSGVFLRFDACAEWLKGFITDKCEACGSCVEVCPLAASGVKEEHMVIDIHDCVNCERCAQVCPVDAY